MTAGENDPASADPVPPEVAAWRAAAAASADPRWARPTACADPAQPGQPGQPGEGAGAAGPAGTRPSASSATPWAGVGGGGGLGHGGGGLGHGGGVGERPWGSYSREAMAPGAGSPGFPGRNGPYAAWEQEAAGPAAQWGVPLPPDAGPGAGVAGRGRWTRAVRRLAALPPLAVVAGGLGAVWASTMTWSTASTLGLDLPAVRGTDAGQNGWLTLLLGALAVVLGIGLAVRRSDWCRVAAMVAGLVMSVVALVNVVRLGRDLDIPGIEISVDVGPGLWLLAASGALIVMGSALSKSGEAEAGWRPA